MNPGLVFLAAIAGTLVGAYLYRLLFAPKPTGYMAFAEYWVYTLLPSVPRLDALIQRMGPDNPHNSPKGPCITPRESALFTDVRLRLSVSLKDKNPHAFRPDLFDTDVEPNAETLSRLAKSDGLVKLRYASPMPLADNRHLQFLPHLADAVTDLVNGRVVFDTVLERLYTAEEFHALLVEDANAERADFHVRVIWANEDGSSRAETRGLRKVGIPELRTDPTEPDLRLLITGLITKAAQALFLEPKVPETMEFDEYGDRFVLRFRPEGPNLGVAITRQITT